MKDPFKTNQKLLEEISALKQRIKELEQSESECRQTEETIYQAHSHLYEIIEFMPDATFVIDADGKVIAWNSAMEAMTGVPKEDMIGKGNYEYAIPFYGQRRLLLIDLALLPDEDFERNHYQGVYRQGNTLYAENYVPQTYKGKGASLWGTSSRLRDAYGNIVGAIESIRDITDRKRDEQMLRESEAKYRSIFENAIEGIFQTTPEGRYLSINPAFARMFGYASPKEMMAQVTDIGKQLYVNSADRERLEVVLSDQGYVEGFETEVRRRDGTMFWISINARSVRDAGGVLLYFEGTNTDITDRKQAEGALRKSEQILHEERDKLQTISENAPFAMVLIDKNGVFTYVNPTFREMFGYDLTEIPDGRTWFRKAYPDEAYRHSVISTWVEDFSGLNPGERKNKAFTVTCKNSTQKIINFIPLRLRSGDYLMTCEDFTELKHLEAQLRQSQKMEAIGTLAGGVAHDFNNILTTIIGYGNLLQIDMDGEDPRKHYLDQILASSQKAANLTQSLLAFSRKQVIELKPHSLNTILKGMEKLLKRLLTEDIEFNVVLANPDVSIMADMTQIDQVLMNLAANARDAMPKGGRLIIEAENIGLDSEFVQAHGYGQPGSYALISISDTGCGMDETTREKIFEPFFTTKEVGRGTGLGLSIVYGIVKQHNGHINVYSEPNKGTIFKIYFPAVKMQASELKRVRTNIPGGKETILVAEDDNALRMLVKEVLMRKGYTVIEAIDGKDAIQKFMEQKDTIDLLILDVVMPRMNGKEVYEEIRTMRPDIKTLFTSGYTSDVVIDKGIYDGAVDFISKPLSPGKLLLKVREVLDK